MKGLTHIHCLQFHPNCEEMASEVCMVLQEKGEHIKGHGKVN